MLADEKRQEVSAEHMRSAEGTQSAAADTRSVEGMQVDYLEKARKLADSYSLLVQRRDELRRQYEESKSWFYTRDEIIYKLSQGAHERPSAFRLFSFFCLIIRKQIQLCIAVITLDIGCTNAQPPEEQRVVCSFPEAGHQHFSDFRSSVRQNSGAHGIRPCSKDNPNAVRWGRLKDSRWSVSAISCRGLAKTLFDIMEWEEDTRYRFRGEYVGAGENKMLLFQLDEPEMIKTEEITLPPQEPEQDGTEEEKEEIVIKKKMMVFPAAWADSFGRPITSLACVNMLEQEHYAGNWDILRPAKEVEDYNFVSSEELKALMQEAERIMEGWENTNE